MIEISKLSCSFGETAVFEDASFKVNNGRIYGVFGAHGCGKSTLLALLAGAILPEGGSVRINGFDTAREPIAAKKCVGYMPREANFYKNLTVFELLDFIAGVKNVHSSRRFLQVHEILGQVDLEGVRDRMISFLSSAELRRLALAQALVGDPEILLLDEPAGGLDPLERRAICDLIREQTARKKTVFYATSNPKEITAICDEVLLLQDRSIAPATPLKELLRGDCAVLELVGEREAVEEALADSGMVASCARLSSEHEGNLRYRIKTNDNNKLSALSEFLHAKGMEILSVEEEPLSAPELALRRAAGTAPKKTDGEEETV